ncbi:2-hydroxyacid dehydrogenase [Clostridium felsineum]|uniref:2-hydroxyacid dehydrogenase n=1 Tax=Clostridium felsineum TaxID=36839 RepID=UPI00098C5C70|nr:2-hydroxyacid dehydrogenase [Clostridium felsineum]URZ03776.1 Hydroxypyruvate reductase [Clostridium felsineum]
MKILIMLLKTRVERFSDLEQLPKDWELVFAEFENNTAKLLQIAADADVIFADVIQPVSADLIQAMPNLKLIHSEGVGYNNIDIEAANKRGIYVCNNAGANSKSVAEHTIMLMLAVLRHLVEGDFMVRSGRQLESKSNWINEEITELYSCKVGILGMGAIGKETAKRLKAFGCEVSYYNPFRLSLEEEKEYGAAYQPLDEILKESDIVSLHFPVTPENMNFIDKEKFSMMKKSAILINTARGEIINQEDLIYAIENGMIVGAGLDALAPEPVTMDNSALHLSKKASRKITFSPHIAGATKNAFITMHRCVWENVKALNEGRPLKNVVNR